MKTSIKLFAVAILLSSSVFAKSKKSLNQRHPIGDSVYFHILANNQGIKIGVVKKQPDLTSVTIYDADRKLILTDKFPIGLTTEKRYILGDPGTYYFVVETPKGKFEKEVTVVTEFQQVVYLK